MTDPRGIADLGQEIARAEQLRRAGQAALAEETCRRLIANRGPSGAALNMLALLVAERGALEESEGLLRQAVDAMPREPALRNNLGKILAKRGDTAGAEEAYRKAVSLKPDFAEAYYNLGVALHKQEKLDEALAAYRRVAVLSPRFAPAHTQIGALLHGRGDHQEALEALDKALASDGNSFDAHYYRGCVLGALKRSQEATDALAKAVALRPQRFEANYALGNALLQARQDEAALKAYRRTIELQPDFIPAHGAYNDLAWTLGHDVTQHPSYGFARARLGDTPDLLLAEAELRMRFSQASEAEELLRRASGLDSTRADIANALGRALAMQSQAAESCDWFGKAIELEPDSARHRQELAIVQLTNAQPEKARQALEEARALAPFDQTTLAYLSSAYRALGDSRFSDLIDIDNLVAEYELAVPAGFSDTASFNQALAEELERLHTQRVEPSKQTLRNGTQTTGDLFGSKHRLIDLLERAIRDRVRDYIRALPDDPDHPFLSRKAEEFSFAGSWSCRLRSSGFHTNHIHNQGWISSAYYVFLPEAVQQGDQGWIKFGESRHHLAANDHPLRKIQPAVGKLVLFPSYYWHGTVPFTSQDRRLTVAFDVVPGTTAPSAYRAY